MAYLHVMIHAMPYCVERIGVVSWGVAVGHIDGD